MTDYLRQIGYTVRPSRPDPTTTQGSGSSNQEAANRQKWAQELAAKDKEIEALAKRLRSGEFKGQEAGFAAEALRYAREERADIQSKINAGREIKTTLGDVGREVINAPFRGAVGTTLGGVAGVADYLGFDDAAESVRSFRDETLREYGPPEAASQNWMLRYAGQGGEAVGSTVPFLAGGVASVPVRAAVGGMAFGTGVDEQDARVKQAREQGIEVSSGDEFLAETFGGAVGLAEMLPVRGLLARAPKGYGQQIVQRVGERFANTAAGRTLARGGQTVSGRIAGSAIEEGLQEAASGVAQDLIELGVYNPNVEVGQSALQDFALGGFAGGVIRGGREVVGRVRGGEMGAQPSAPAERRDTDLISALETYRQQGGQRLLESPETVALRDLAADDTPIRAGGLNLTPRQLYDFAANNASNPRIAEIMAQPVSPTTKVQQVARVLNAAEASRVEGEVVRRVSGLFGPTQSVSSSKQAIGEVLDGIGPEVVAESPTLSAIRSLVDQPQKGQRFVTGLREIVDDYGSRLNDGQSLTARPARGVEGSVIMTQDKVADEAQREREAAQAFRLARVRQERFDRATGTGQQREDLRAGASEPESQFFLGEAYGELAGTPADIVEAASPNMFRVQYESPSEVDSMGRPLIISEEVSALDLVGRVVRGSNRLGQDLETRLRNPRGVVGDSNRGWVGSDLNPRRSVDRTRTRAVATQESGPPAVQPNLTMEGLRPSRRAPDVAIVTQNAQQNPTVGEVPAVEGIVESPTQVTGAPTAPQLPAPPRALPAPNVPEQEGTTPEAQDEGANVPEREVVDEEIDIDNDPRMVELNDRFDAALERVQETENTTEARKLAKKLVREGVLDEDAYADIDAAIKDEADTSFKHDTAMAAIEDAIEAQRDNAVADLESEIYSEADAGNTRFSGRTSKRKKRVRPTGAPRPAEQTTEQTTDQTTERGRRTARQGPVKSELTKAEEIINDRLAKIAGDGQQGARIAQRVRELLDDRLITVPQLYAAFEGGKIASQILPKNANVDIVWVPILRANSARAAVASGTAAGQEAGGSYDAFDVSQDGLSGIIRLSLSENVLDFAQENAAHEAFHVIQDMLEVYDPAAFNLINSSFKDGGRVDDFPASILRKLKTLTVDGNQSVYQSLKASFGNNSFSFYEAQAVAFGALVDAKNRGENMKGLPASFIRVVDFAATLFRDMGKALRLVSDSPAEIFDTFRTGQAQERLTESAPLRARDESIRYSARQYNPEKGFENSVESLKEDIAEAGGQVLDATSIDQLVDSNDIPVITLRSLIGKKIFPTISDRTAAAALYTGIDSSKTVAVPLLGGPNFPLRKSNVEAMVAWANRGGAVLTKKNNKIAEGANYMMVVMGSADMHKSNTTVNNAYFATLNAYARDGRISGDNATALEQMIREAPSADPRIKKYLSEFPSFADPAALDAYIQRISFDARSRIMQVLDSKAAFNLGAPSMKQILDATREPAMAGYRWGDGVLVLELEPDGAVALGESGTSAHPDFPLGIRGKVVGRLETPVNYELIWKDFLEASERKTKARGKKYTPESGRYDFQQSLPTVTITQKLVDSIGDLAAPNIDSARQARLASDMALSNWRISDTPKNKGGVSVQEFVDAINNSPAKAVLNEYVTKDVAADIKSGKMRVFQLGNDGQIFFALKKGDPQYAEDYGIEIPMIGKDEVMVTAVINNEQGARGIAGPAVMLKAIEEGATVLDCFAVKSEKYPNGFLPALYEMFGFVPVAEVPFDPQYYSDRKLADAVKYWQDSSAGYDPKTDGYPPLVIMKWNGTDEQRTGILERYLASGIEGLFEGRDFSPVAEAEAGLLGDGANASGEGGAATDGGRAAGAEGTRAGLSIASRAGAVVEAIAQLSDQQLANLGLTERDRENAQRKVNSAGTRFSGRTRNNAGIDQSIIDKVTSEEPKAGVFGKFLDKMVGRVGNESRRRALVRNTTNNADGMFELDRMLDAAIRGVDPADGRVPVDGSSVGRIMEMMAHSNGVLQAALELGPPVFDGELTTISDDISGLFDIFAPIGESRADAFQTYAVARRESDLRRRGRVGFTELTDAEIAKTLSAADPDFAEVFERYQEFNGAIIDYAIDTGYLSEELGEKFKDMDYIPYYRAYEQDDGSLDVLGPKMQAAINNPKSGLDLKLKGGKSNLGNLYENIIRNTQSIISAARKNLALQEAADAVDALNELGIDDIGRRVKTPEGEGIMRLRVEGKPVYYKIEDPAVWFAIAGLGPQQLDSLQSFIRPFTNVLRMSITMPTSFMIANLWRGKISAYVTTDANLSLGLDTLKGMKDAFQSGEATKIIKANTGMGGYDYGMGEKDFANEIRRRYRRMEGNYNSFTQNAFDRFRGFIAFAEKFGEASEFAERVKLYNDIIANGGSPKTAAYEAMNLTNFGRKGAGQGYLGATLKYLIPMVPFLNARIQGLYRIAENQQNEETILGLRKKVLFRGLLYTAISSAIYAAMSDDDRWDEETAEAKMLYDIIYIGDMRFTLPRPFEVGTIFGSLPVAMYDYVRDRDGKEAARKLRFAFVNTFAMNPIPPAVLTAGEVTANYSVFRSGPIDNMSDMNLPAGMRYDERTSEVSKAIGGAIDVSPKKLDYLVNGYLGPMGAGFLSGIDSVLSGVGAIPKKADGLFGDPYHIADTIASVSGITRFVKDSDRATSRFVRDFYELKKEADQANRARKKLIEEGRNEEALEFAEEMKFPLRARKQLGRIAREISKVNKQIDLIEVDPKLTPAEKQLKLKPLLKKRKALARSGYDYARGMRMPDPEEDGEFFEE